MSRKVHCLSKVTLHSCCAVVVVIQRLVLVLNFTEWVSVVRAVSRTMSIAIVVVRICNRTHVDVCVIGIVGFFSKDIAVVEIAERISMWSHFSMVLHFPFHHSLASSVSVS